MPFRQQLGPANSREIAAEALAARLSGVASLAGAQLTGQPLQVYSVSGAGRALETAADADILSAATPVGWDYQVSTGDSDGIVHLQVEGDSLRFAGLNHGWIPRKLTEALAVAQRDLGADSLNYEARLLHIPSLQIKALWLAGQARNYFVLLTNPYPSTDAPLRLQMSIAPNVAAMRASLTPPEPKARESSMAKQGSSGSTWTVALILIAALAVAIATSFLGSHLLWAWLAEVVLVTAFLAALGSRVTQHWFGILVDGRNKISLSRLQIVLWTILFVSTFLIVYVWNVAHSPGSLALDVPPTVWVLMGLSGLSAATAPAILSAKPDTSAVAAPLLSDPNKFVDGVIVKRRANAMPEWADIVLGDDAGNGDAIDFSKIQQLLLSAIAVVAYGYAIAEKLMAANGAALAGLPEFGTGFLTLIGASHATYLAYKGVSHTN